MPACQSVAISVTQDRDDTSRCTVRQRGRPIQTPASAALHRAVDHGHGIVSPTAESATTALLVPPRERPTKKSAPPHKTPSFPIYAATSGSTHVTTACSISTSITTLRSRCARMRSRTASSSSIGAPLSASRASST